MTRPTEFESCSTFFLQQVDCALIGHNLDERTAQSTPGVIFINQPGEKKFRVSFKQLRSGNGEFDTTQNWVSKYGSITFSIFGKDFADGGLNEAGLYIQEMTLVKGELPKTSELPFMYMSLWMQYQLDTVTTVREVLESLSSLTIDGWSWHFFVTDATGNRASIDWIAGVPIVHEGASMPYPVMTNYSYEDELTKLGNYEGFGGEHPIDLDDLGSRVLEGDTRFHHACHVMQNLPADPSVDDAFKVLYTMDRGKLIAPGGRHWSYVIDLTAGRVWWETSATLSRKYFDISSFNFNSGETALMIDIHTDIEGDARTYFRPVTPETNWQVLQNCKHWLEALTDYEELDNSQDEEVEKDQEDDFSWQTVIERMQAYMLQTSAGH